MAHPMANKNITLTPTLFFHGDGADAAAFYTSLFPQTTNVKSVYNPNINKTHAPITITLSLLDQTIMLINVPHDPARGSTPWRFNESFSFSVVCDTQEEIDYYWEKLTADGGEESQCCWCKDRFGVSWQLVPRLLLRSHEAGGERASKATSVMMGWKKPDVGELERALEGVA